MAITTSLISSILAGGESQQVFVVGSQAEMLALVAKIGDVAIRTDVSETYILKTYPPSILANWQQITFPNSVFSVFGRMGAVTAQIGDYSADQITNAADKSSSSVQTFNGLLQATQGIQVTEAGGGLQFLDTGTMTGDSGISFFEDDVDYRLGFENNGGSNGWIRQNVDLVDSVHGFIWSSGMLPNTNYFMLLDATGKLALGANANTVSMQSLANIYGDLFLGNVSTPSNPTLGGKLYSKLISGNSDLYYLDSSGTEHQLTNASAGLVTSVFARTGAITAQSGDYTAAQITNALDLSNVSVQTMAGGLSVSGKLSSPTFTATGITGAASAARLVGANASGAPVSGTFSVGDYVIDLTGKIWLCTASGTPGTWVNAGSSGNLVTSVFGRTGAITSTSGDYTAAQVTNSADKASASAQIFSAVLQAKGDGASPNQLVASGSTNTLQQLTLGYDTTNNVGYMQAILQGTGAKNLALQPSGGSVGVGYGATHSYTNLFEVGGSSAFAGLVSASSGINIAQAGGGVQFVNSGNMTVDKGVSFFQGNQQYRISFDDNGATRGWIRQNVDTADSAHGYVWSAGTLPNTNYVMHLDGAGTFVLSANAHTASKQSLANIYGDLFLGNISLPATPSAGGKIYAKSGQPYWLDSSGVETAILGEGSYNIVNVSSSTYTVTGAEDIIYVNATSNAVAITISSTVLNREVKIYKKAGSVHDITITPAGGQLINGSSSSITIYSIYDVNDYVKIVSSDDGTNMYLSGINISFANATSGADWRPSGIQYQWGFSTYGPPIAPGGKAQVTILWPAPFPTAIFDAYPKAMEATTGLPIAIKVISQNASQVVIEVQNQSVTLTTAPSMRIAAFAIGN